MVDIIWSDKAIDELNQTLNYLIKNFTLIEIEKLEEAIINIEKLIKLNPNQFQQVDIKNKTRKIVILKYNTLYYEVRENQVEILSFFSNRKEIKLR